MQIFYQDHLVCPLKSWSFRCHQRVGVNERYKTIGMGIFTLQAFPAAFPGFELAYPTAMPPALFGQYAGATSAVALAAAQQR